jgi:hypothetical protein
VDKSYIASWNVIAAKAGTSIRSLIFQEIPDFARKKRLALA